MTTYNIRLGHANSVWKRRLCHGGEIL